MKRYLNLDKNGKILSLIKSSDPTLRAEYLFEVSENDFKKVSEGKNIKNYKVKNKQLIKKKKLINGWTREKTTSYPQEI